MTHRHFKGQDQRKRAASQGYMRASFIGRVRQIAREYREGRGASACMKDIEEAVADLDARLPSSQGRSETVAS